MSDVKFITKEFKKIKTKGYVESVRPNALRRNDGAVGNTLETLMGIKENNDRLPDFEGWEIKTQKRSTRSWSSLFSLKPDYPEGGDNYMKNKWGKSDETYPEIKCLRTSIYGHRFSKVYGKHHMKLIVDRKNRRVKLLVCNLKEQILDESVYWKFNSLKSGAKKLENLLFVKAEHKKRYGKMFFKYTSALVCKGFQIKMFFEMLEEGLIRYDHRLGIYRSGPKAGCPHNHGGGFRICCSQLPRLFKTQTQL